MRMLVGGREVDIPTGSDGFVDVSELRRRLGVPSNRALIHQKPTGENEVLPVSGRAQLHPYGSFLDTPRSIRGMP